MTKNRAVGCALYTTLCIHYYYYLRAKECAHKLSAFRLAFLTCYNRGDNIRFKLGSGLLRIHKVFSAPVPPSLSIVTRSAAYTIYRVVEKRNIFKPYFLRCSEKRRRCSTAHMFSVGIRLVYLSSIMFWHTSVLNNYILYLYKYYYFMYIFYCHKFTRRVFVRYPSFQYRLCKYTLIFCTYKNKYISIRV